MTKFQRLYEAAIYRTLGASTRLVAAMVAVEYGSSGLLAGALGAVGALGLSWALARICSTSTGSRRPRCCQRGVVATAALVGLVGVVASIDVLLRKAAGDASKRVTAAGFDENAQDRRQESGAVHTHD